MTATSSGLATSVIAFRFSRYDPRAPKADTMWTAFGDVGKVFSGGVLTREEFVEVEASYLKAMMFLTAQMDRDTLRFTEVVVQRHEAGEGCSVAEGQIASEQDLPAALTAALREQIAFILRDAGGSYLFVAFDLYVHFGRTESAPDLPLAVESFGLFVEEEEWMLED